MMRICYIIGTLEIGGAEKQLLKLCRGLDRSRFEPVVVALRGGPLREAFETAGIPVVVAGKRYKVDVLFLFRLAGILRAWRPDVVHTWMFTANTWGRMASLMIGVPVRIASERCVDPWKRWYHTAIDRVLLRYTWKVIPNSKAVRDFYGELEKIPESKMVVIGNGIDENTFATTASFDLKRQLGVGAATHLVCAGGRFTEQKGFDYLVGAVPAVVRKFPGVRFVIVGDGPLMGPLVEKTGRLGVKDVVVFLGYRNDILEIFSLADAIAVPSLFEGMPNVVLEAMALGKTVVGSDIPEIREVVEEGKTGFLVPVRDAGRLAERLIAVLEDGATREEVGRQAKEFARAGFSVSSMVGKYEEIYEKLLPGKAG